MCATDTFSFPTSPPNPDSLYISAVGLPFQLTNSPASFPNAGLGNRSGGAVELCQNFVWNTTPAMIFSCSLTRCILRPKIIFTSDGPDGTDPYHNQDIETAWQVRG